MPWSYQQLDFQIVKAAGKTRYSMENDPHGRAVGVIGYPGKGYHYFAGFALSAAMMRFMASMPTLIAPLVSSVMGMARPAFSRS